MGYSTKLVAVTAGLFFSLSSFAITVGQFKNPAENFLDCDKVDSNVRTACFVAQDYINARLNEANIYLDTDGILYKIVNEQNINVKDDCSRKTTITRQELSVKFKKSARLSLSGNALSKPAVFALKLPVETYGRFDGRDEFGQKVFTGFSTKCVRYATDSYYGDGGIATTAQLIAFLSLEPQFKMSPEGDYIFALKPIFDIQASVGATKINNFDIHGANAFLNIFSQATSLSTDLISASESVLKGESVKTTFTTLATSQLLGQAESLLLTDYALSNPLLIDQIINSTVQSYVNKSQADLNQNLSNATAATKAKIASALNLDANGKVYLVIGPDFKQKPVTEYYKSIINQTPPCTKPNFLITNSVCMSSISNAIAGAQQTCGSCGIKTVGNQSGCISISCGIGQ